MGLTACTGQGSGVGSADVDTVEGAFSEQIDAAVSAAMEQSGSSAAIVGVWTGDAGEYVTAYGDESLDANARIRAAQASQPVACALLLDLAAQGSIDLDRKVSKDLTRQVGIEDITYRQLCEAKSGLADFKSGFADIFANNPTRPWVDRELLAQALTRSPLPWPGLDVNVSDTNALLLSRALRVRTDQSAEELLSDHVFGRAGMRSSYYPDNTELTPRGDSMTGLTYPMSGGKPVCDVEPVAVAEVSPTMLSGAGATVTTVTDLKNFYEHYLDGTTFGGEEFGGLVTETTPTANPERDEAGEPIVPEGGEPEIAPGAQKWGFGLENVGPLYGQSGAITGTMTAAYHDPESGLSVVVALNNSSAGAGFARALAFQLSNIAAENGAGLELPWTAEDQAAVLAERAVCQSAPEAPAEG
ncbi:beta-lactamase family protein [Leucobacter sp. CSA1]|uniref:Beta-lactamase family protein n=2 Tax=Leucobacter chromiisoli TaxID=2796471 RepID=A0A934Q4N0_9MICO|nr:beta-lactamase family protein [Leucobacter chromiisoli]